MEATERVRVVRSPVAVAVLEAGFVALATGGAALSDPPEGAGPALATGADTLIVELDAPQRVSAGDSVPFVLRVSNPGPQPREIHLTGRPTAFDIVVRTQDGETVWRRLHGGVVTMILELRVLAPGESLAFEARWDRTDNDGAPVPPGEYAAHAVLPLEDHDLRTAVRRLVIEE